MLKKFTDIKKSPKKITIPPDDGLSDDSTVYITLGELNEVDEFQRVTVYVKVIYIGDPTDVSWGKMKQDITVTHCMDNCCLTIWEDRVNMLDKDASEGRGLPIQRQEIFVLSSLWTVGYEDSRYWNCRRGRTQ